MLIHYTYFCYLNRLKFATLIINKAALLAQLPVTLSYGPQNIKEPANTQAKLYKTLFSEGKHLVKLDFYLVSLALKNVYFTNNTWEKSWLFSTLLGKFMYFYTQFQSSWVFTDISIRNLKDKRLRSWLEWKNSPSLKNLKLSKYRLIKLFFFLTYIKDPSELIKISIRLLLNTHLKKHKRVFSVIRNILSTWYLINMRGFKILGYSLFFKGKLAKKGSVKKTKFFSKKGRVSFTNKNLRVNYKTYIIWTFTGSIGAGISIFF